MGAQLAGKTLGIVGLGRIGQAVAKRAQAFEMRVLGFDPFLSRERTQELGVEPADGVRAMLPEVDYLTVHTPLTDETRNLIGQAEIELLQPTARLVNCARGGIYDEAALAEALKARRIAGVALDVYASEPCTDSPLFGLPGVLCTPHLGASTEEAQTQVAVEGVGLLGRFSHHRRRAARREHESARPANVGQHARAFERRPSARACCWRSGTARRRGAACCNYRGEVAAKNTKLLTAAFAVGLLENALEEEVNIVNAELLAPRARHRSGRAIAGRSGLVQLADHGRDDLRGGHITARPARSSATKCRGSCNSDHHRLEAFLDGVLMIFTHRDVPGIIGRVGTIFGRQQINIAQMAVGRAGPGGEAIGVLNLDQEPTAEAMAEVTGSPDIQSATVIRLPAAGELPSWLQ